MLCILNTIMSIHHLSSIIWVFLDHLRMIKSCCSINSFYQWNCLRYILKYPFSILCKLTIGFLDVLPQKLSFARYKEPTRGTIARTPFLAIDLLHKKNKQIPARAVQQTIVMLQQQYYNATAAGLYIRQVLWLYGNEAVGGNYNTIVRVIITPLCVLFNWLLLASHCNDLISKTTGSVSESETVACFFSVFNVLVLQFLQSQHTNQAREFLIVMLKTVKRLFEQH